MYIYIASTCGQVSPTSYSRCVFDSVDDPGPVAIGFLKLPSCRCCIFIYVLFAHHIHTDTLFTRASHPNQFAKHRSYTKPTSSYIYIYIKICVYRHSTHDANVAHYCQRQTTNESSSSSSTMISCRARRADCNRLDRLPQRTNFRSIVIWRLFSHGIYWRHSRLVWECLFVHAQLWCNKDRTRGSGTRL